MKRLIIVATLGAIAAFVITALLPEPVHAWCNSQCLDDYCSDHQWGVYADAHAPNGEGGSYVTLIHPLCYNSTTHHALYEFCAEGPCLHTTAYHQGQEREPAILLYAVRDEQVYVFVASTAREVQQIVAVTNAQGIAKAVERFTVADRFDVKDFDKHHAALHARKATI